MLLISKFLSKDKMLRDRSMNVLSKNILYLQENYFLYLSFALQKFFKKFSILE